MKIEMSQK